MFVDDVLLIVISFGVVGGLLSILGLLGRQVSNKLGSTVKCWAD